MPDVSQNMQEELTPKKKAGLWLKAKGTAIGVAIGAALVATGDYLLGDTGIIAYAVFLIKQAWQFIF